MINVANVECIVGVGGFAQRKIRYAENVQIRVIFRECVGLGIVNRDPGLSIGLL